MRRDPTPTPTPTITPTPTDTAGSVLYFDDFSDDDSDWPDEAESDNGRCYSEYRDDKYRIEVEGDGRQRECFRPAPEEAEYRYGIFEVEAKRRAGSGSFSYGLYINGRGGGEYYLFRVRPRNDCGWDLIRREDDDSDTVRNGGCDSAIERDSGTNKLEIKHTDDGRISVYVNDKLLATFTDDSELEGRGTGLYVRSGTDENNTIDFDNFTIFSP